MPEAVPIAPCNTGHMEVVCESIPPTSVTNLSRQVSQPSELQKPACQEHKARETKYKVLAQIVNVTENLELLNDDWSCNI